MRRGEAVADKTTSIGRRAVYSSNSARAIWIWTAVPTGLIAAGLSPIIPEADDRVETHRIIYNELCRDIVHDESRVRYERIAQRLIEQGCDCLILGCTEVGMLLNQNNVGVPVFDAILIHCKAALRAALQ